MRECIFCKIINKELPAYILFEDDQVTAFLDINPVSPGHILIVPNKHYAMLHHIIDDKSSHAILNTTKYLAGKLVEQKICESYSIIQANGRQAEQEIDHVHFHIIPRHINDSVLLKLDTDKIAAKEINLQLIYKKIRTSLNID